MEKKFVELELQWRPLQKRQIWLKASLKSWKMKFSSNQTNWKLPEVLQDSLLSPAFKHENYVNNDKKILMIMMLGRYAMIMITMIGMMMIKLWWLGRDLSDDNDNDDDDDDDDKEGTSAACRRDRLALCSPSAAIT